MKIEELVLLTNNIEETKQFYTTLLNLEILEEQDDLISFRAGSTTLIFRLSSIDSPDYHFAFNIPCNKIEEAQQWCVDRQLDLLPFNENEIIDFPNWNAQSIYFLDNNGNILEFISRFDLQNQSEHPFSAEQILTISEIGIVSDDVIHFCDTAIQQYGITYYEKQKPAPDFSVLGDAEGLLIVVPKERKWFPTTIPSKIIPFEMIFMQNGKRFVLKH